MKLNKEEVKLFKESHSKWLAENKFLAKLFTKAVKSGVAKNPNIKNAINRADAAIDKARDEIERKFDGNKKEIKNAIPISMRKYLGFDY
jgi:hypothetical protein